MKDFVQRIITIESPEEFIDSDGEKVKMVASRSRNTNGFCSIRVSFGKQCMEINCDIENYEQATLELSRLLNEIANNPCLIPKLESQQ